MYSKFSRKQKGFRNLDFKLMLERPKHYHYVCIGLFEFKGSKPLFDMMLRSVCSAAKMDFDWIRRTNELSLSLSHLNIIAEF